MRPSRKPRIILVFLIALCGLFVYSYTSRLAEKSHLDTLIEAERGRIAQARVENAFLQDELAKQQQPDALDQAARKLFDRGKPGDKMLVIVDPEPGTTAAGLAQDELSATNPMDYRSFPIWRQWVYLFTSDTFTLSFE